VAQYTLENKEMNTTENRKYDVAELLERTRILEERLKGLQEEYTSLYEENTKLQKKKQVTSGPAQGDAHTDVWAQE
jgi:hypothetical protein